MTGALDAGQWAVMAVLMLSSLLNIAYLLPIPLRGFFSREARSQEMKIKEAPWPSLLALCFTATGCVFLFFFTQPLYELASAVF